jgi:hypothetical protein
MAGRRRPDLAAARHPMLKIRVHWSWGYNRQDQGIVAITSETGEIASWAFMRFLDGAREELV